MNSVSTYYAFYDISKDENRNDIIKALKDIGFVRIQESVFCGSLSSQQKKDLIENIGRIIIEETDSFLLILSCKQCFGKVNSFGRKMDLDWIINNDESMVL
ncbi:MAG: CRISPR-associated endonuclease Cas2 [Candidatus Nitrosocosmicus sp.]|nr:CRISPR-associated endonuclease Cas2 [Candidatus Nitrosocosmicus sp.]